MKKGQHIVASAVLLVLIILVILSGVFLFARGTMGEVLGFGEEDIKRGVDEANAKILISDVYPEGKIEITNIGKFDIPPEFDAYFNDTLGTIEEDCPDYIDKTESCNITVVDPENDICSYHIIVSGPYRTFDDVEAWEVCG